MSKLLYTHFTKLILDYLISLNKSIPRKSDSKLYSSQDGHTITKLLNTTNGDYKFGMEVPDAMISDAIKKKVGGRGKGFMCYGDQVANVPNKLKKDVVPRKTRSLIIAEEAVVDIDSDVTLHSSSSNESEESTNETDDADESNMDLSHDNPHGDDDDARYGVFMHNKSIATPNSTYFSPTVTSSSLDFIQTLLDEAPTNELTDFMSHPVYTDAQTTLVVHNPEVNPELTSKENSLSYNNSPTKLTSSQNKEADAKGEQNIRKFNFKKAFVQKFKEYDQKLEALTNFNVSEAFEKGVQAKVLTEIKKLLPTHIPNAIANYVKPRLNTSMLENKLNDTHTTHQQLYDTLYESIFLDQDALDAQAAQSSFHKRSHDNQDPPNNHEGENKKKQWFPKKSGLAKRSTTWFDLFLKLDIDKNENHILGPSTVAIAKKFKELIQKDKLTIAYFEGAGLERLKVQYNNDVELEYHVSQLKAAVLSEAQWNSDEGDVSKPRSFERHMSKSTKPHPCFYNNNYTYLVDLSTEDKYTTSITKHYAVRYYKEGMSVVTEGNVFSDLRIKLVVRIDVKKKWGYGFLTSIVVRISNDKEYEFNYSDLPRLSVNDVEDTYLLQVQDKLHHLPLEFVKDFNNALLMFIRRTVIKNRVEDIQLGMES
ncbi:hypothetical protein Tco_0810867 [Tanacetum coccineum]